MLQCRHMIQQISFVYIFEVCVLCVYVFFSLCIIVFMCIGLTCFCRCYTKKIHESWILTAGLTYKFEARTSWTRSYCTLLCVEYFTLDHNGLYSVISNLFSLWLCFPVASLSFSLARNLFVHRARTYMASLQRSKFYGWNHMRCLQMPI